MQPTLIRNAEIAGQIRDLQFQTTLTNLGTALQFAQPQQEIDAQRCAVLPGLHDHHIHLYATAAASNSLDCRRYAGSGAATKLARAIQAFPGQAWVRGVAYHESLAGDLDRWQLDNICADRPVRLQHRSGKLWILNSAAIETLALQEVGDVAGVERDQQGRVTGRLWRLDQWLQARLPKDALPSLKPLSRRLASYGITSVTDASYTNNRQQLHNLQAARTTGELQQKVWLMGDASLRAGPYKILLDEDALPDVDALVNTIQQAHQQNRPVAFHAVSHVELVFALAALAQAGCHAGDRIEHAGVVRPEVYESLKQSGATVVTQPGFLADRGDSFLRAAEAADRHFIYPFASLLAAGVQVVASSDAPYGPLDPWRIMQCAVDRCTETGAVLNPAEQVLPAMALRGYLARAEDPGGSPRTLERGEPADLIVLDRPLAAAYENFAETRVLYTFLDGRCIYKAAER